MTPRHIASGLLAAGLLTSPSVVAAPELTVSDAIRAAWTHDARLQASTAEATSAARGAEADRVITRHLAPLLKRDPATLCGRVCVGPAGMCAELLSGFAEAGCGRVHFWPLGAEGRQVDLIASTVPGLRP